MDIQLPGMDGLELTRKLKADPTKKHILIFALTAYAMKGDEEKALAAGCEEYVTKPIDLNNLRALLARTKEGELSLSLAGLLGNEVGVLFATL